MISDVGQLELLPAKVPEVRRASLHMADVVGHEYATPSRELVELIARLGLLQPIVVAGSAQTCYRIIEGRRRAKAIEQLAADGRWPSPPRVDALIVTGADGCVDSVQSGLTLALHAARSPSPASELAAIEEILTRGSEEDTTIAEIASQTGMPVQTVRRRLRLRALSPALRAGFDQGELSASIAEAAARLPASLQTVLADRLVAGERLTLGAVRDLTREQARGATLDLPDALFAEQGAAWQVTVGGHLRAALEAVPPTERNGRIPAAIETALAHIEGRRDTTDDPERAVTQ